MKLLCLQECTFQPAVLNRRPPTYGDTIQGSALQVGPLHAVWLCCTSRPLLIKHVNMLF